MIIMASIMSGIISNRDAFLYDATDLDVPLLFFFSPDG